MKSIRLFGLIGLMALTGCSHDTADDNGLSQGETPITFNGILPEAVETTRADEPLSSTVQTFKVWSYKNDAYDAGTNSYTSYQTVIPGFDVNYTANSEYTTTSNTNGWEYVGQGTDQTIKYWDWGANAYRFFAVAPGTGTNASTAYTTVLGTGAYEPNDANQANQAYTFSATVDASSQTTINEAPYFSQLWFSTGNPTNYPDRQFGRPVKLRFLKPFARVRFMFTIEPSLNIGREKLKDIKFHPTAPQGAPVPTIAIKGTAKVSYPLKGGATSESWTITPGTASGDYISAFTIDYREPITPVPNPDPDGIAALNANVHHWYTVLPAFNQGTYTIEVAVVTDEVKTAVVPAEYMVWKPGYEYTYKFKITETGGITMDIIQVAINDWSNRQSSNHTVYNW